MYDLRCTEHTKSINHLDWLGVRCLTGTVLVNGRDSENVLIALDELVGHVVTVDDLLFQDSPEQAAGLPLLQGVVLDRGTSILGRSSPGQGDLFGGDTTAFNGSRSRRNIQNFHLDSFLLHTEGVAGSDDIIARVLPASILDGQG